MAFQPRGRPYEHHRLQDRTRQAHQKGLNQVLSSDDMADELTKAAEDLTTKLKRLGSLSLTWDSYENDPVGDVIASHRP